MCIYCIVTYLDIIRKKENMSYCALNYLIRNSTGTIDNLRKVSDRQR